MFPAKQICAGGGGADATCLYCPCPTQILYQYNEQFFNYHFFIAHAEKSAFVSMMAMVLYSNLYLAMTAIRKRVNDKGTVKIIIEIMDFSPRRSCATLQSN